MLDGDEKSPVDASQLEQAFALFNEASRQLVDSYHDLEGQVATLSHELALANGALRNEYEAKLALTNRLSALLQALPAGVVELDTHGKVQEMNAAAEQMLSSDCYGRDWPTVKRSCFSIGEEGILQVAKIRPGQIGDIKVNISESHIEGAGGTIVLLQDVTEAWMLQQKIAGQRKLVEMGEMAAGLAHQLRTPLATALLYGANLTRPELTQVDRLKFSGKLVTKLKHLEVLIKNMLQFVRGRPQESSVFPVGDMIEDAAQLVMAQFESAQVTLRLGEVSQTPLKANRKELAGVVANLLENSLHASTAGQVVEIFARCEGDYVTIEVIDNGAGIAAELQDRLFEPFFTTKKEGTGLGLAIVRSRIQAYGGSVQLQSQEGKGATVRLTLPVATKHPMV